VAAPPQDIYEVDQVPSHIQDNVTRGDRVALLPMQWQGQNQRPGRAVRKSRAAGSERAQNIDVSDLVQWMPKRFAGKTVLKVYKLYGPTQTALEMH
jgi:hypothetical protein